MNIKTFIKSLSLLHLGLVLGVSIFCFISYWQSKEFGAEIDNSDPFLYVVPMGALIGYFGSQIIFKNMLSKVSINDNLSEKLNKYQSASIIKYAILEGPAFLAIIAYRSTGNALPLVIAICLILYLAVQRPNRDRVIQALPLTGEEKRKLQHN